MFDRLPMYQRIGPAAYKNNLDNIIALDDYYGNPHRNFSTVHVAGTNGKGSVSHMLSAILQSAGYKTGLYTSPHLKDFRERIRINGKPVTKKEVIDWVENFKINNELWKIEPSFFELTVAMAFDLFSKHKVDIAITEVGLGGRLDSTNIISPEVSVITNIGLDHTTLLGDTIEKIAMEKAGIIKPKIPIVIGTTQPKVSNVFIEKAKKAGTNVFFADQEYSTGYSLQNLDGKQIFSLDKNGEKILPDLKLDLLGFYQKKNLPAVLKTIEILVEKGWEIKQKHVYNGLAETMQLTGLIGRWQIIGNNPLVVCDTGHNADGIRQIVEQIQQTPHKTLHFIFGMVNDKDPEKILSLLPQNAVYYFTKADIPRALNVDILAEYARKFMLSGDTFPSVKKALTKALSLAGKNDLVFIGGSTFVVAEVL